MTTVAPDARHEHRQPAQPGLVRWRPLARASLRQHRAALIAFAGLAVVLAAALAVTGLVLHPLGQDVFAAGPHSPWHLFDAADTTFRLALPLLPALAGMFIGAPLIAREIETGTARFTWAQSAGRTRWLVASVLPVVALLVVVAAGIGLEYRWWLNPLLNPSWPWRPDLFSLTPVAYAGWMVLGFCLGVCLGAAIRRTVPAMAATLASYIPLLYLVAPAWRRGYLPALHRAGAQPTFSPGGGYGYSVYLSSGRGGPGPDILSTALGWPSGRLLTAAELRHQPVWLRAHHIRVWITYQPGSRLATFQLIEFGWLVALSVLLVGLTVVLIRRRAA